MKYSQWIGVVATLLLLVACFLPWAWYPDLQKNFTGFFSEKNIYGKPGRVFLVLGVFAVIFFLIPRVWAKRWNLFTGALILAFAIKSFILFSGCYSGICPDKKAGLWLMLGSALLILLMAVFPDQKLVNRPQTTDHGPQTADR